MSRLACLVLCGALFGLCGCQSMSMWRVPEDQGALVDDPWSGDVGKVARSEHPPEAVHDPLGMRNFFSSDKARQIERNVGVGD